jgi:hypothetical protein
VGATMRMQHQSGKSRRSPASSSTTEGLKPGWCAMLGRELCCPVCLCRTSFVLEATTVCGLCT